MDLNFNEEQEILRNSTRKYLEKKCPMDYVRLMWEDPIGCAQERWDEMGNLGWFALRIPEAYEGLGLGFVDLGIILEEMGRVAMPGPFSPPCWPPKSSWTADLQSKWQRFCRK